MRITIRRDVYGRYCCGDDGPQTKRLDLRMTEADKAAVIRSAQEADMSITDYVLMACRREAERASCTATGQP